MKFDLISDFHVEMNIANKVTRTWKPGDPEYYAWDKDRKSPILVVAGDTSNMIEYTMAVILEASMYYAHILFVDGNHEHYSNHRDGRTVPVDMDEFRTFADELEDQRITYLDGERTKQFDKTLFIGANGWFDFSFARGIHPKQQERNWKQMSNDPRCCRFGKKNRPEKLARRQATQLKELVEKHQDNPDVEEIVVVTHTLPHWDAFGQYRNPSHEFYPLNGAYGNAWMKKVWEADKVGKVKTWCFGHTHDRRDFFDQGVRFISNPRGYRGEKKTFGDVHGFEGIQQIDTEETPGSAFGEIEG